MRRGNIDWQAAADDLSDYLSIAARHESLQSLQEAYEQWLLDTGRGVGVVDMFWSWNIQA